MKAQILALGAAALVMNGCAGSDARNLTTQHTTHIWQLDRDATRDAAVSYSLSSMPPESRNEPALVAVTNHANALYGSDALLELASDGTYSWRSYAGGEQYRSAGQWKHVATRSGVRIHLVPQHDSLIGGHLEEDIASWILLVDSDAGQMKIMVAGHPGPVLRRVD